MLADLTADDVAQMSRRVVRLHLMQEHSVVHTKTVWKDQRRGPLAGAQACVCSALQGSLLSRVSCSIYNQRPEVCRSFEPGSARCKAARRQLENAVAEM